MPKSVITKINATRFERPLAAALAASAMFMVMAVPPASLSAVPALAGSSALHAAAALIAGLLLGAAGYAAMAYPWPRRRVARPVPAAPEIPEDEHSQFAASEVSIRLRRADRHPDAPVRAPIFASRDLGSPFMEVGAFTPPPAEDAAEADHIPEGDYAEVDPVAADEPAPVVIPDDDVAEPEHAEHEPAQSEAEPEPVAPEPAQVEDEPVQAEAEHEPEVAEHADIVEPVAAPVVAAEPEGPLPEMPAPIAAFAPEIEPAPAPARAQRQSIAAMMDRLSAGLERRAANGDVAALPHERAPALRDALEELNRIAARRG